MGYSVIFHRNLPLASIIFTYLDSFGRASKPVCYFTLDKWQFILDVNHNKLLNFDSFSDMQQRSPLKSHERNHFNFFNVWILSFYFYSSLFRDVYTPPRFSKTPRNSKNWCSIT